MLDYHHPLGSQLSFGLIACICAAQSQVIFCTPAKALEFGNVDADDDDSAAALLPVLDAHEVDATSILAGSSPDRYLLRDQDPIMNHWGRDGINDYWKRTSRYHLLPICPIFSACIIFPPASMPLPDKP